MPDLPSGTVTFLFTDVEGSTKLLHELGPEGYARALAEHRRVLREAFTRHGGVEVDTQGDAFFVAFPTAPGALEAAREAQQALADGPIQVRMGIHTGTPHLAEEGYVGADVHRAARIAAAGHGGQVLVSAATVAEIRSDGLVELGEHRLKDFEQAVPLYQLGGGDFPPLKTISNTNLPRPASSFVGREQEVAEIASLLEDGARLLTLTGPGGTGKTRLALETAAELVPEFKAGVFWVGLAPLRDPALVTETIAHTLGAKDGLAEHIGERELLLVLDNLEQVVDAAPALAALVETCPNLRLLATSRELLRVRGEVEYAVSPLADPDAVQLFCQRSGLDPDETIAELCRALDNLPLAVELAAARARLLSPKQILERLSTRLDLLKGGRDADPRQQTLRATIEWSYELLTAEEQQLFARLSVFRRGCTLQAAEEVCNADLDVLQSLIDKSLVRQRDERFWMLETIREYAGERLQGSGEADRLARRHAEHYLALAEAAEPHLVGDPKEWLDRLEPEHDNLRAAFDGLASGGEGELALRLATALARFWTLRGYLVEGARRLEAALVLEDRATPARADALGALGYMAIEGGDAAKARRHAEESLTLHRRFGDEFGLARSHFLLGHAARREGDFAAARDVFEESRRAFSELGDEHLTMMATFHLAWICGELGDGDRGRALYEENLRRARAIGNKRVEAFSLDSLAALAREEGRVDDALAMLGESLRIWHDMGAAMNVADTVSRIARALADAGEADAAARLAASSIAQHEERGVNIPSFVVQRNEETFTTSRALLDDAAFEKAAAEGRNLTPDEAVVLALGEDE